MEKEHYAKSLNYEKFVENEQKFFNGEIQKNEIEVGILEDREIHDSTWKKVIVELKKTRTPKNKWKKSEWDTFNGWKLRGKQIKKGQSASLQIEQSSHPVPVGKPIWDEFKKEYIQQFRNRGARTTSFWHISQVREWVYAKEANFVHLMEAITNGENDRGVCFETETTSTQKKVA